MFVWRITKHPDLSGRGGLAASGRWHTRPRPILYTAEHALTAYRELFRYMSEQTVPDGYKLVKIEIPDYISRTEWQPDELDPSWSDQAVGHQICRPIGDSWLASHSTALLRVPSAARPGYFNILINPILRETEDIKIIDVFDPPFSRLMDLQG